MTSKPRHPIFISATGTDAGKTLVSAALAARCRQLRLPCPAIKPIETGCAPDPTDALTLAQASNAPDDRLARDPRLYRAALPLAPRAISIQAAGPELDFDQLCHVTRELLPTDGPAIIEGAGGLLVPLTRQHDLADLMAALALPAVLVTPNRLGVLSHALTAIESLNARGVPLLALVLNQVEPQPDLSSVTNLAVLAERLVCPVLEFPHLGRPHDHAALARAAADTGLFELVGW